MTQYLGSEFLQGAKADQLVSKFNNAVETFDKSVHIQIYSNIWTIQISSGEPKVLINSVMKEIICLPWILELLAYGSLKNGIISSG